MNKSLWATIDPASNWRPDPTGGYVTTDDTPSAATQAASHLPLSPSNPHFGFLILAGAVTAGLFWIYEGKGSGAKVSANLGPVGGTVEGGVGEDQ